MAITKINYLTLKTTNLDYCRYPDDVHDRTWSPFFDFYKLLNTTLNVNNTGIYETPKPALATAATPSNDSHPLIFSWKTIPQTASFYVYLHFAEIQDLRANDTREFDIYLNEDFNYTVFSPPKLEQRTLTFSTVQCPDGKCRLRLERTKKSTLPPLLNAMEAYTVIEFPFAGTDPIDGISHDVSPFQFTLNLLFRISNSYVIKFLC